MDISIIILTCNELDYLKRCLPSVLSQNSRYSYEIILIDNGSADGTIEYVEQYYPMLKIIRNGINLGVAKGRNQGAAAARGRYLLFLDVDTVVPSNALVQLIDWMEKNRGAAICGPKLVYPDGRLQYSCRTFPTPLTVLARGSFLGQFLQNLPFYKRHLYLQHNHGVPFEADWVMGAAFCIRKDIFDALLGFDEYYFFGYEEIDLCRRAKESGLKTFYCPDAVIIHDYRRRSVKDWRLKREHIKSIVRFFGKKHSKKIPNPKPISKI